jgi:DNA repair protein RadA/Sms
LGICRLSEDHSLLAYTLDNSGDEIFSLYIKNLKTGEIMSDHTTEGVVSVEWAKKSRTIFYTVADKLLRPSRYLQLV